MIRHTFITFALLLVCLAASVAQGQSRVPDSRDGVGVDEKLDAKLPFDLKFTDEYGNRVSLEKYFDGKRPVLLTLNYADCPQLCGLQLNGLVTVLRELEMTPGDEFEVITVSIDHEESTADSQRKKREYIDRVGKPEAASGWHFLTGGKASIKRLADSVGFRFKYDDESGEYIHAAVMMLMTPDGRVSRYIYGIQFPPKTMKYSLIEASDGRVGSAIDKVLLICFYSYDPDSNSYGPVAMKIMRTGGVIVMLGLFIFLFTMWRRERKADVPDTGVVA